MVFLNALCFALLTLPLVASKAAGDKGRLTAKCPNGKTCVENTSTLDAVCTKANKCVCKDRDYVWGASLHSKYVGSCLCPDYIPPCGAKADCCTEAESCVATRGGGSTAAAPKKCTKRLDCAGNRQPCGHSRAGNYPTHSTTCCAADEQCTVDPDSGAAHTTKCTKLACAKGRQACGHKVTMFTNKHGHYFEQTPDNVCCAADEECHIGHRDGNVSKCKKTISCPKGREACGANFDGLHIFNDPNLTYYLYLVYSTPNNVCCATDESCNDTTSGGFDGSRMRCEKS
ncbi:hypothetical protein JKP88DRAFT_240615 [Tribonema minus]|uniref:Uncharacterized protein n=1 Tax=Tribonema minus TaxID=303371 RepID=A0A835ZQ47_9STRA|nr:hypothetical protein JKP88DRAFT_240615 [Tribonema minus]